MPVAVWAARSSVDPRWPGRHRADSAERADPGWPPPEEPAAGVPGVQAVPGVQVDAAAVNPASVVPGRWEHPVPDAPAGESSPGEPVRGRLRVPDERRAAGGCPDEHPRAAQDARAARPAVPRDRPVRRWGRACYQAGWECSLTTPSLHRLRCPRHPVRSRRRCARSRAVCRLHRDSSTARPWSVGRLSGPAWQQSE